MRRRRFAPHWIPAFAGMTSPYNRSVRELLPGRVSILFIAVLAAIVFIIAGCGADSPTATSAPTFTPTAVPTDTPLPPATAVPTATPEPELPQAPDFSLSTGTGEWYSLDDLLVGREALVLVFYRSFR